MNKKLNKLIDSFFNTRAAAVYLLLFAVVVGAATFIENDYGTPAAQKVVYKQRWFELLLIFFCISLVYNIVKYKFIKQKKWANLAFHLAMVIIIIGAGITRYFGYEGMMHIREGSSNDYFLSSDTYLNFEVEHNGNHFDFSEPVLFAGIGNNSFKENYSIGGGVLEVALQDVIPNPANVLEESEDGKPIIKVVFGGSNGRSEYFLVFGESKEIGGVLFNFSNDELPGAFNISLQNANLVFKADETYVQTVMATQTTDTIAANNNWNALKLRALYNNGKAAFVFGEFVPKGKFSIKSESKKISSTSNLGLVLNVKMGDLNQSKVVLGMKGDLGSPTIFNTNSGSISVSYGAKPIKLPFKLALRDFEMERYPGTNSPASFASEVTLIDSRNGKNEDFRIYMNHILDYDGYRFFQSSYDRDEKGTYLSVNHDFWGTWVSYIGYILLTIGMVMVFFTKNTRFTQLGQKLKMLKKAKSLSVILLLFSLFGLQNASAQNKVEPKVGMVSKAHAEIFSQLMVQDFRGRVKPMHTQNRELLRKINRSESIGDWNADQVILSMYADKNGWFGYPLIALGKHEKIGQLIGVNGKKAAFKDFFTDEGKYKLQAEVSRANNLKPIDRGVFEKQLIKVDEKLNIVSMIFSGSMLRIIPIEGDENNTWVAEHGQGNSKSKIAETFFSQYNSALHESITHQNDELANKLLLDLQKFQRKAGAAVMPSESKIAAEVFLNNSKVFNRLALVYTLLGMVFLVLLFTSVFKPTLNLQKPLMFLLALVFAAFAFHTLGLGLRWYVSGRAPWSNGYESMIYIAWTTTLAGVLFTRKSIGGLAATMVLAGVVLLIAMLSYLDPEITPLVPVLKSYWLTIHVSLEAGSYGFLMLGAIIGLINLLLMATLVEQNVTRVKRVVKELSYISEMTLIGGLVMLSIGTYLGGVWANESWGRYWGWDAKETWALVSILVYAFILHMRLIPKIDGAFAFNFATLFGLSSIIMTYFGVNYYLSGLHSYAAGDPIPIPNWVYVSVVCLAIISAVAYWQKRRFKLS